jgi:hypothetical protein
MDFRLQVGSSRYLKWDPLVQDKPIAGGLQHRISGAEWGEMSTIANVLRSHMLIDEKGGIAPPTFHNQSG